MIEDFKKNKIKMFEEGFDFMSVINPKQDRKIKNLQHSPSTYLICKM